MVLYYVADRTGRFFCACTFFTALAGLDIGTALPHACKPCVVQSRPAHGSASMHNLERTCATPVFSSMEALWAFSRPSQRASCLLGSDGEMRKPLRGCNSKPRSGIKSVHAGKQGATLMVIRLVRVVCVG